MDYKEFDEEIDLELLTKYFAGECLPDEEEIIKAWILSDKKNEKLISSLKKLWDTAGFEDVKVDTTAAWEKVSRKIDPDIELKHKVSASFISKRTFRPVIQKIASIAAVFLIIIGGYTILQLTGVFSKHENTETVWNVRQTLAGEKSIINFNDGTKITLNGNSKLKYSSNTFYSKREVYLEGEAFFEVTHDSSKPFIVYCNNIAATDLGTKFDISAYSDEKEITISLVEGKVNVSENESGNVKKETMLQPKQQYLYSTTTKTTDIKVFDVEEITGWKDNLLKFKDETLLNVFLRLERAYGVKFELVPKSFENYLITTNFKKASLSTISEAIKKLTGLNYNTIKENDQVKRIVFTIK